jgi:iron(III) transport system permease protein
MSNSALRSRERSRGSAGSLRPGLVASLVIGAMFAIPAAFVVIRTLRLEADFSDTLREIAGPFWRTIQLAVLVSASTAALGTLLAWVTVRTDLPLRRAWRVVLMLPLVLPSFVGAGAFIAGLAPDGVIHTALEFIGITPPRRFRGLGASWLVLTAFTYPYVLLPVSARLASLRPSHEESARMLGFGRRQAFFKVTLPAVRSAVLGGSLLVFLYTLSEFGAVQLLGYDTLTRVIFTTRQADRSTSFAAATALLLLAIVVVFAERRMRGRATPDQQATHAAQRPTELGWRKVPATLTCAAALSVGLLIPVLSLMRWALRGLNDGAVDLGDLVSPTINTASVAIITAVITVLVVLPIAIETTRRPRPASSVAARQRKPAASKSSRAARTASNSRAASCLDCVRRDTAKGCTALASGESISTTSVRAVSARVSVRYAKTTSADPVVIAGTSIARTLPRNRKIARTTRLMEMKSVR